MNPQQERSITHLSLQTLLSLNYQVVNAMAVPDSGERPVKSWKTGVLSTTWHSSSNLSFGNLHFEWVKCSGLDNRRGCLWHGSVALSKYTLIYTAKGCQVDDVRDESKTCSCLQCNPSARLGLRRVRHGLITCPMGQLQGLCASQMRSDMQNNEEPRKPHQPVSLNNSLRGLNLWLVAPYIQPDPVPRDSTAW